MTKWTFPPPKPEPRPCQPHKVWGSCGICDLHESIVAARLPGEGGMTGRRAAELVVNFFGEDVAAATEVLAALGLDDL